MSVQILTGDCRELLKTLPDASVDSVVTDPPYGISFMGKRWDYDVPSVAVWTECLRVLKPGGYLLAFAGTRTQHRMACRIEDAGFEIRDMIAWVYGSGFPKSHNGEWGGTALKPALEPITMARKPLVGTVEQNWREHGTGALNIEASRIPTGDTLRTGAGGTWDAMHEHEGRGRTGEGSADRTYEMAGGTNFAMKPGPRGGDQAGRWPANLIHDGSDEVIAVFPSEAGAFAPVTGKEPTGHGFSGNVYGAPGKQGRLPSNQVDGRGSAARFFYCAKADRADRNDGLHGMPTRDLNWSSGTQSPGTFQSENTNRKVENHHPTVKPTDLMRYLVRLVTPVGGTVLDPFMGSGSTLKAAELEGFSAIGMEIDPAYVEIAKRRIGSDAPLFAQVAA